MKSKSSRFALLGVALAATMTAGAASAAESGRAAARFFVPADIPRSRYRIDARIDLKAGLLEGRETIELKNLSPRPVDTIALDWTINAVQTCDVAANGAKLAPRREGAEQNVAAPLFYELPSPLLPGSVLTISAAFHRKLEVSSAGNGFSDSHWYPRLWWDGLPGHDSYSVALEIPPGYVLAVSGRKDGRSGRFEAAGIKSFGLYLAKGESAETREADGVLITAISTEKGKKAAAFCLETAVDAVKFYKKWLGFYPYPFLTIVPGGAGRWGGYPFAPGIVAIHGLETYKDGESPQHWRHITSHEIGHQYWGEWVLDGDNPEWLWISLGIHADTEYMIARKYDPDRRVQWMGNYVRAVAMYYDTTLDVTPVQDDRILYDRNNLVIHSKGPAFLNALEVVLGPAEFDRIYRKALRAYGGKRLGWREFQRFCEAETSRNLTWFFDSWVRGNSYLCYAVESKDCRPQGQGFRTEIRVRRLGTMAMPIPLRAVFEDGSEQTVLTDRTKTLETLIFESRAKLKEAMLDPERRLAVIARPLPEIPARAASLLAWGWDAAKSLEIYEALAGLAVETPDLWYKLGLGLYETDHFKEAADCFEKTGATADPGYQFLGSAWLGLIADLRGERSRAIDHYREALSREKGQSFGYGNLNLRIDRKWIEARLQTPYVRESAISLPENPTADQIVALVNALNWTHEGRNPRVLFAKAANMDIPRTGFWFKLGMVLFDSGDDEESLAAFAKAAAAPDASRLSQFAAWVWQGHLNDLLRRRDAALAAYRKALEIDPGETMSHSQYGMSINRRWVEARLKAPFTWKKRK